MKHVFMGHASDVDRILNSALEGNHPVFKPGDYVTVVPLNTTYPEILCDLGFFPTKGQARNCGWNKEIPEGFSTITFKKKNEILCFWKISTPLNWDEFS